MSRQTRLSTRISPPDAASRRKRRHTEVSYREPDSDDDYDQESDNKIPQPEKTKKVDRAVRKYPKRHSSRTSTPVSVPAPRQKRRLKRRSSTSSISETFSSSSLPVVKAINQSQDVDTDATTLSTYNVVPRSKLPWDTLEYDILLNIFLYGAGMLKEDKKPSNTWLINAATTCRAFQTPALAALYQTPPLDTVEAVRGFLAASARHPDFTSAKVKHIRIEAIPALTRKDRTQDPVLLETILEVVPNIRSLAVELLSDAPSSKRGVANLSSRGKANVFKSAMIDTMDANKTHLKSMKWNYFLNPDQQWPWCELPEIHARSCMQTVENLEIVWLNIFTKSVNKKRQLESLVEGIKVLSNLKSLTLSLCSLFTKNEPLLAQLPANLQSFTIIDCDDLMSEDLGDFLLSHGSKLRQLVLSHNRSLNLGFMSVLGSACPLLEDFKVDISCYGLMMSSTDSEPSFQSLLPGGVTPTWPVSLRHIEMSYLRKWERDAATIFFQSLVNSAQNLKDLRHLTIKTTVDLDWRDRVAFRDEWSERLQRVFKRRCPPPNVSHTMTQKGNARITGIITKRSGDSQRIKTATTTKESIALRLRTRIQDDANDDTIDKENHTASGSPPDHFIQGLCNVVDIRIENLRPMETQYAERDFMDEEVSGDEDWTGQDNYDTHLRVNYAW